MYIWKSYTERLYFPPVEINYLGVSYFDMGVIFKQTKILVLVCMTVWYLILPIQSHPASPMQIFPGYRCLVQYRIYTNITRLHPYSCRYDCMVRPWCAVINENVANDYCQLSNGPCIGVILDGDFRGIAIDRSNRNECLMWTSNKELLNAAKTNNTCIVANVPCIVGRFYVQSHLLPGNNAHTL